MPAGRRVLVTRPEPGAAATARRLAEAGFAPLVLPLSRVAATDHGLPERCAFDAVAATSAHAVRLADAGLLDGLKEKPFFAVGGRTARTARRAGFTAVREGAGDAAALARLVLREAPPGAHVLYLCGRVRRADFEAALQAGGLAATPVETYDTLPHEPSRDEIGRLGDAPVDAVLLTSVLGTEGFARLLRRGETASLLERAEAFALSSRIAAALPLAVPCRVAARPDEDSLLAALEEWAGN